MRASAASIALWSALFLTAIKFVVGAYTHSVGVISEGIHSSLDLVSAALAYFTIREAGKPADDEHPFGHGKFETLSALVESLLLVAAAGFIVKEGIDHILHPVPIEHTSYAIATIAVSLVVSYAVYLHNSKAARFTESAAIQVNALHFLSDAVTSAGVLIALIVIHFTGVVWVDPLVAFAIAIYILAISWRQVVNSVHELLDKTLPAAEIRSAESILSQFKPRILEIHDMRTRKSGVHRHFNFHVLVCGTLSVRESHEVCDEMEVALIHHFPDCHVAIHVEPCGHPGTAVPTSCARTMSRLCEGERRP